MTSHTDKSLVGEVVPLAPLGINAYGTVIAQAWSPALGRLLRVRQHGVAQTHLVYGDALVLLFPEASTVPVAVA